MNEKNMLRRTAQKYLTQNKLPRVLDDYLKLLKQNPADWNLMIQIGDLYLKDNQVNEAVRYFVKVADHYTTEGFMGKAIAIYRRVLKINPDAMDTRFKLAELHFRDRHLMEGKTLLETAITSYREKGNLGKAIQVLNKLLEFEPHNLQAQSLLAESYEKNGMISEAVAAYLEIANQYAHDGAFQDSLVPLEKAHCLHAKNPAVMLRMISVCIELNDKEKAAAFLQEFLGLDLTDPEVLAVLARTFGNEKQLENLQQFIDQGIPANFRKEPFWILMGELYLKRGDLKSAFYQFLMAIEEQARTKEIGKGVSLLRKITRLDTSFYPAWRILIDLYSLQGDQDGLLQAYSALIDAYISKTMYEDAANSLQKLQELEPGNRFHQDKLEFVKSLLEHPEQAEKTSPANQQRTVEEDFELEINLDEPF